MSLAIDTAQRLIASINAITQANTALGVLAQEQRKAISKMDSVRVGAIVAQQREVGHALADAEESRRREVAALCRVLGLPASASINDVCRAIGAHDKLLGQSLRTAADEARKSILACQREQRVVQAAATGVMAHLDGLARQVLARVNRAGLYAATGALACGNSPRGVDLVS